MSEKTVVLKIVKKSDTPRREETPRDEGSKHTISHAPVIKGEEGKKELSVKSLRLMARKVREDLDRIKTRYSTNLVVTARGVLWKEPTKTAKNESSIGIKKYIDYRDEVCGIKDGYKECIEAQDYDALCETIDFEKHHWIEDNGVSIGREHDGIVAGLHVGGALLTECGLYPIHTEEFALGGARVVMNGTKQLVGSIDVLCLDDEGKLVAVDIKTYSNQTIGRIETMFLKKHHAIQLHTYKELFNNMAKNSEVDIKIDYCVIIGYANRVVPSRMCAWKLVNNDAKWLDEKHMGPIDWRVKK